jgi:hypothetical protein
MKCIICETELAGRQTKYCSVKCKRKASNNNWQIYAAQKIRGERRKQALIDNAGGECILCGYSKNSAALCFHHRNPDDKLFGLDVRSCSNRSETVIIAEAKKCDLLCMNCHTEVHNPQRF